MKRTDGRTYEGSGGLIQEDNGAATRDWTRGMTHERALLDTRALVAKSLTWDGTSRRGHSLERTAAFAIMRG